jgi:hypothetical protein
MAFVIYHGTDIEEWVAHFKFSQALHDVLCDSLGVGSVEDLNLIYTDEDLIKEVENHVTKIEFKRFLKARLYTNVDAPPPEPKLADSVLRDAHPPAPPMPVAVPLSSLPSADREELARKDLAHAIAASDAERLERETRERIELISRRRTKIKVLERQIARAASVDVAFLLDCTGSMRSYMTAAKNQITQFARDVKDIHPNVAIRIAFVGYRDHCDKEDRLAVLRFVTDVEEFVRFVEKQDAKGGGDAPEDVLGGLNVVKGLEWESETRMLYHIADAPCHGSRYHGYKDDYPDGDPHGLQPRDILLALKEKRVQYCFGKVNNATEQMLRVFNEDVGGEPAYIQAMAVDDTTMMTTITSTVIETMTESVSSSSRTDSARHELKSVVIVPDEPLWPAVPLEEALRFRMTMPESIESMLEVFDLSLDKCIEDFPDLEHARVKVAPSPFAKGAMRAAYYAQMQDGSPIVIKECLYKSKSQLTKPKYEATLQCHRASLFLAREFNRVKPAGCPSVEFCEGCILQFMARPDQPYMVMEGRIPGHFEKYNNNSGYRAPNPTPKGTNHDAVQAFSHWTQHISHGNLLVVDCQGGFDQANNRFVLTDPAVHCKDLSRFGNTNLGPNGFDRFFAQHKCNDYCRALGLTMPK